MEAAQGFLTSVQHQILEPIITLLALGAFVVFIWGVVDFIRGGATETGKKEEGRMHMVWGIVGLVVIFGANAIVSFIGAIANSIGR